MKMSLFEMVIAMVVTIILSVALGAFYFAPNNDTALERLRQDFKIESFQKDLDYLTREDCKNIIIVAINKSNETKDCKFLHFDCGTDSKSITVMVDGKEKSYAYEPFMSKIVKVECGDDFSW